MDDLLAQIIMNSLFRFLIDIECFLINYLSSQSCQCIVVINDLFYRVRT